MRNKIKVVFCINDFLVGGAQRMLAGLLSRLDRERFEPILVTLFYWEGKDYFYDLVPGDVPVHRLNFRGFWDIQSWFRLYALMRILDPDILLSNLFFSNTVIRVLGTLFRFKVFIVEHNTYIKKTKFHQRIDKVLSRVTEKIVAVSNTVAEFTSAQENIPREKFVVIHNGIDIEALRAECDRYDRMAVKKEFGIAENTRVILSVARLTTQKNPLLLLEGFALFSKMRPLYALVIVGGSPKWELLLGTRAKELGVAHRVFLFGTRKDVARFYAIADIFVSTSTIEGFGIAHAEALACGVPVLSTKTAGPDEMIKEGENGFFISESTPEAVAEGLEKMISADLETMRGRAKESIGKYGIDQATVAYANLFSDQKSL